MSSSSSVSERTLHTEGTWNESFRLVLWWGVAVGILQALSPLAFWWLSQDVVWALSLVVIASIYIGFAVADGRPKVIGTEILVTSGFVVLAAAAITVSPWLSVVGLLGHGAKDFWQHRTQFVANTRWWPPFCFIVDVVVAAAIAGLLIVGVDL